MRSTSTRRVVVLTGASAGVGRATARLLARQGASLGLIARGRDGLAATQREVERLGGEALAISADVADADALERAASLVEERFGSIDVWINNAMVSVFSPVQAMTGAEYRRVTEVTYLGAVWGTRAALRRMQPRDRGVIVQVGSALAYRAIPLQSAYCAAKHALRGFTDALRCELLHDGSGVHVTMVHLPALDTPQFDWVRSRLPHKAQPMGTIYAPEVAARAIAFAVEHPRREHWVGWSSVRAIVGGEIAPVLADRVLAQRGYQGQQTSEPEDPRRPDNLDAPVEGDRGAHGRFGARSVEKSPQQWASRNRGWLAAAAVASAGIAATYLGWRRRRA